MRRRILLGLGVIGVGLGAWLGLTGNPRVWPIRNTLQYRLLEPRVGPFTTIRGTVRTPQGTPIPNARVLVASHQGKPYSAESDAKGEFTIANVPAGEYVPIVGAPGYNDTTVRKWGMLRLGLDETTPLTITLTPRPSPAPLLVPASNFRLSEPRALQITKPLAASAISRTVEFDVAGRRNQETLYFTPNDGRDTPVPVLLAVYPGIANSWDSVSFPLAQAGYAVIAIGPAYALDLEQDVDDLERVLDAVRAGKFPRADPNRIGVLGGSYSSLHLLRLLETRQQPIDAALFLGPPTDLFEMRRQFMAGDIFPPFGLDQALIALGFPDRNPEPYWRYSARYHVRALPPQLPIMLIHSKADEIVPFEQAHLLSDELNRIGHKHELHILEGMGHYLLATERTPAIDDLFNLTLRFFGENLR